MNKWSSEQVLAATEYSWEVFCEKYPGFTSYDGWRRKRFDVKNDRLPLSPSAVPTVFDAPLHLDTPNFLYLCDLHAPYHNAQMLDRAIFIATHFGTLLPRREDRTKIEHFIIGGDLFNFTAASKHPKSVPMSSLAEDGKIGGQIVETLLRSFAYGDIIAGNHDKWFGKALNAHWPFENVVKGTLKHGIPLDAAENPRLRISDREWMTIGDDWVIGHPRSYSGQGGKVPADRAQIIQKNVIAAHNHVCGMQQSKDGKWVGIDPGHMTDPAMHYYLQEVMPGQFTAWTPGFTIVYHNKPYMFNDLTTDWTIWGC